MSNISRWQDIYEHLKKNNIDVYAPGQHEGECKTAYVVLKENGTVQVGSYSSTETYYDVLCYVPKQQYSSLTTYFEGIKEILKGLYPMVMSTNYVTPDFYDDTVKGHMRSIQYKNYRKI